MGGSEGRGEREEGGKRKERKGDSKRGRKEGGEGERSGEARVGEIQEAIFEEKSSGFFHTKKSLFPRLNPLNGASEILSGKGENRERKML